MSKQATWQTRMVQPYQIRNVKILQKALGLDEDFYRYELSKFKRRDGEPVTSSTELTEKQASEIIERWYQNAQALGKTVNLYRQPAKVPCTQAQVDYLMALTIRCAIHYASLKQIMHAFQPAEGSETETTEAEARAWMLRRWKAKSALPTNVVSHLMMTWANPKCNEYLERGGFREHIPRRDVCFFNQLTPTEASYLIQRFKEIAQNLDYKTAVEVDDPAPRLN
jgi:hypothetical protein